MKEAGSDKEQKSLVGRLFTSLRGKDTKKADKHEEQPPNEPKPEPGEEELAAIEAERERAFQELIQAEKDCMVRAEGSRLYQLYQAHHGIPPVTDDDGCYSLTVFTNKNELPSEEQRLLLIEFDRQLALSHIGSACRVLLPENALNAHLFVLPQDNDGFVFTNDDITAALDSARVTYGVIDDRVESVVEKQKYLTITRVAEGVAPTDGKDGEVIDRFRREVEIKLKERADGTIDYRDLGWLQTTAEGDVICDIAPPKPPKDGLSVRGEPIPGKPGTKASPPIGSGVMMSDDGSKLQATMDGVVLFREDCFHVEPLLIVEGDVDSGVGNLDLIGSVIINGDLRGGFSIKATGNVTIQGRVENAHVEAGGSVQVGNGMNGNETGVIRAGGDVVCRYIEHSTVTAGNRVVSDTIINSTVSAGNTVDVTTGRATIVGGRIVARSRVQAQTIGNYANTLTTIILGDTLENLAEKKDLIQKSAALSKELNEKEKDARYMGQRPVLNPNDRKKLEELRNAVQTIKSSLRDVNSLLASIEQNQVPNTGCFLRAGTVHPPLELTISGCRTTIRTSANGARFVLRAGEVAQIPY